MMQYKEESYVRRLWEILAVATYLGVMSFGGPLAHLGYFHKEYVKKRKWVDEVFYADIVALCQFLPGPASSQIGIAIGTYRGGYLGGILAWLGFTIPSVLLLVYAYYGLQEIGEEQLNFIHGLKIVAVAVISQAVWGMGTKLAPDKKRATIVLAAAMVTLLWPAAYIQIIVLVAAGILGLFFADTVKISQGQVVAFPVSRQAGLLLLLLLFILLLGLPILRQIFGGEWIHVIDVFFRIGSLVFGGGHVVLPMLEKEMVPTGWVDSSQFLVGYGLAQAVPGPLFTFAAYLGVVIHGWMGAMVATIAIFLPSFLLVWGVMPFWNQIRKQIQFQKVLWAVNAAVVGILLAALYNPVWINSIGNSKDFAIGLLCFGLLQYWKVPPWCVVLLACFLSII
ncbi:chromate efflux transporter [Pelosinus sp. UFO1]|uniref:chromate efflux transporter n=1 Tax=Pelosinus sp. UFO1 TaxID=484770 RepID=UPI00056FB692|nr:chromate efflux transporter [Pelosinus sp. UFO1]